MDFGNFPGKDEVAKLLLEALRQDKKDVVVNADITAEVDQSSFKSAEKQINELTKTRKVDVDTSKAEQKIKNLLEPLRKVSREIKNLGSSGANFNIAHNTIKAYEQLKSAVSEASQSIDENNQELIEARNIIGSVETAIKGLDITVEKATKKRRSRKAKSEIDDIKSQTNAIESQAGVIENASGAMDDYGNSVDATSKKMQQQIDIQKKYTDGIRNATQAQKELNQAQEKQLKLTRLRNGGGYATDGDLYKINKDAGSNLWLVYKRNADGIYEYVNACKTLDEIRKNATIIAEQESYMQLKASKAMADAQNKAGSELVTFSNAYAEIVASIGGSSNLTDKFTELFEEVKNGALSASDAIDKLNKSIDGMSGKNMPNMSTVIKRYNEIMTKAGADHRTIGTRFSQDTDGWGLEEMIEEAKYWLSTYYEADHANAQMRYGDEYERKAWKSETDKFKRFINSYEPYVSSVKTITEDNSSKMFDNTQAIERQDKSVQQLTSSYENLADAVNEADSAQKKLQESYLATRKVYELAFKSGAQIFPTKSKVYAHVSNVNGLGYAVGDPVEKYLGQVDEQLRERFERIYYRPSDAYGVGKDFELKDGDLDTYLFMIEGLEDFKSQYERLLKLKQSGATRATIRPTQNMFDQFDFLLNESENVNEAEIELLERITRSRMSNADRLKGLLEFGRSQYGSDSSWGAMAKYYDGANLDELAITAEQATIQNNKLIFSYKDLYKELEKIVNLSKQLKPEYLDEYREMVSTINHVGYLNNKEEAVAEIKAAYENVKRIKSSLKNGLSVYKHIDGDGYSYEGDATEQALERAENTLRGYILSAAENLGYTISEAIDDFPQKRMRYFVEDQLNQYYEIDAKNTEYMAAAEISNAPIREEVGKIISGISNMATSIDNMDKVTEILSTLSERANDVNRYTLSTQANSVGGFIGIQTPYEEIRMNAKRIESYEELCEVIARFNTLSNEAITYGGNDWPGLDEDVEFERRELMERLKLTLGEDGYSKVWKGNQKDIEKLANEIGLKTSQMYEIPNGQLAFIEGAEESVASENELQEEIKETNSLLEGQISIEEQLASAAEKANKQLKEQEDLSRIVSRDVINQILKGVDPEGLLGGYGLQGDDLTKGVDLLKDLAGASYLGDASPKSVEEIFTELYEFVAENAQHTEEVIKTMQDFREHMKHVQIKITEDDEQAYAAEFIDEWKDIKKLYAIGGNSKNKKKLITTSKYASSPDVLMQNLIGNDFGYVFDKEMMSNFNGNEYNALRMLLDAIQRAKDEFKLPNTKTVFGLDEGESADFIIKLSNVMGVIEQNINSMRSAIDSASVSGDKLADSVERAANAINVGSGSSNIFGEIIGDMDEAAEYAAILEGEFKDILHLIADAAQKSNFDPFKNISSTDDVHKAFQEIAENSLSGSGYKYAGTAIKGDTGIIKLKNDIGYTIDAVFRLSDGVLQLDENMSRLGHKPVDFNLNTAIQEAEADIRNLKASLGELQYDKFPILEGLRDSIVDNTSFDNFKEQIRIAKTDIAALKKEFSNSTKSLNDVGRVSDRMRHAETSINVMSMKLERLGNVDGVEKIAEDIERMIAASEKFNQATTEKDQVSAYNAYNKAKSDFDADYAYAQEAKRFDASQVDPIKTQYREILDLVNQINTANERMIKFQSMDGGSGGFGSQIAAEQEKKLIAIEKLNAAMENLNTNGVLGSDSYIIPEDIKSIGTDYSQIAEFINDAGVQASLTTAEIEKLVGALTKAGDIDLSMLDTAFQSVKDRVKQTAYENRYFSDKTRAVVDNDGQTSLKIEDIQKLGSEGNTAREKLEGLAQAIAQNSDGAVALTKNFTMGADGIAKLDFSILDTGTGAIKDYTAALGTATGQMGVFDTTVDKSKKNMQAMRTQMESIQGVIGRLGLAGVNVDAGNAPRQVSELLRIYQELTVQMSNGDKADNSIVADLIKRSKMASSEVEKLYTQMLQMESAIASGRMDSEGVGNPTGDIYGQLVQKAQEYAQVQPGATLQLGRFDAATNTLNASMVHTNGVVDEFQFKMDALSGQMGRQQVGVSKLTNSWDTFKATLGQAGKRLMTAVVGYNVFFKAISEVRKGIGYVKDIDKALTELKKVTDETEASYAKFLKTASKTAGEIGSTISDFTEASANFARLGYTIEESADMAKTAIIYRNVADGLDTVEDATDSIISTMKAFGIESDKTMGIVDRFNEVGNNFAITSAGIGEALQRSASALYAGGNTIDESIALVTAANSVVQNPEQVGELIAHQHSNMLLANSYIG